MGERSDAACVSCRVAGLADSSHSRCNGGRLEAHAAELRRCPPRLFWLRRDSRLSASQPEGVYLLTRVRTAAHSFGAAARRIGRRCPHGLGPSAPGTMRAGRARIVGGANAPREKLPRALSVQSHYLTRTVRAPPGAGPLLPPSRPFFPAVHAVHVMQYLRASRGVYA